MTNSSSSSTGGIGFVGLLTILFVGLKLCHVIAWSWWWVVSPIWIAAVIVIGLAAVCLIVAYVESASQKRRMRKNSRRVMVKNRNGV